jgi:hypothetical protein
MIRGALTRRANDGPGLATCTAITAQMTESILPKTVGRLRPWSVLSHTLRSKSYDYDCIPPRDRRRRSRVACHRSPSRDGRGSPCQPDPIFAAIALHRRLYGEWSADIHASENDPKPGSPEDIASDRQLERADEALRAFLGTAPTTLGGAIAALEYAASPEGGICEDYTNLESGAQLEGDAADRFPQMIADALRQMNATGSVGNRVPS